MVVREQRIYIIRYTIRVLDSMLKYIADNETCETGWNWLNT